MNIRIDQEYKWITISKNTRTFMITKEHYNKSGLQDGWCIRYTRGQKKYDEEGWFSNQNMEVENLTLIRDNIYLTRFEMIVERQ